MDNFLTGNKISFQSSSHLTSQTVSSGNEPVKYQIINNYFNTNLYNNPTYQTVNLGNNHATKNALQFNGEPITL